MRIAGTAATFRRLHGRNLSGWWCGGLLLGEIVVGLISGFTTSSAIENLGNLVFTLWGITLLVLCVLRGTQGPNRFGDDPLGGDGTAQVFE